MTEVILPADPDCYGSFHHDQPNPCLGVTTVKSSSSASSDDTPRTSLNFLNSKTGPLLTAREDCLSGDTTSSSVHVVTTATNPSPMNGSMHDHHYDASALPPQSAAGADHVASPPDTYPLPSTRLPSMSMGSRQNSMPNIPPLTMSSSQTGEDAVAAAVPPAATTTASNASPSQVTRIVVDGVGRVAAAPDDAKPSRGSCRSPSPHVDRGDGPSRAELLEQNNKLSRELAEARRELELARKKMEGMEKQIKSTDRQVSKQRDQIASLTDAIAKPSTATTSGASSASTPRTNTPRGRVAAPQDKGCQTSEPLPPPPATAPQTAASAAPATATAHDRATSAAGVSATRLTAMLALRPIHVKMYMEGATEATELTAASLKELDQKTTALAAAVVAPALTIQAGRAAPQHAQSVAAASGEPGGNVSPATGKFGRKNAPGASATVSLGVTTRGVPAGSGVHTPGSTFVPVPRSSGNGFMSRGVDHHDAAGVAATSGSASSSPRVVAPTSWAASHAAGKHPQTHKDGSKPSASRTVGPRDGGTSPLDVLTTQPPPPPKQSEQQWSNY